MDAERQKVFRGRFVAVMNGLKTLRTNPKLRAFIGTAGNALVTETGAQGWSDLKARADGQTYDKVLDALRNNAADMARKATDVGVKMRRRNAFGSPRIACGRNLPLGSDCSG